MENENAVIRLHLVGYYTFIRDVGIRILVRKV